MRATVTLADDLAAKLRQEIQRTGRSFDETLNAVVRRGLSSTGSRKPARPFRVRAADLKARDGVDFTCIAKLLEDVEGPGHP